jgi:RNA polymerase sigma factor (TIGR02999 family)
MESAAMSPSGEVTLLLQLASQGDRGALDRLYPLVYDELHRMAHRHIRGEHGARSIGTTALVHEVYLKFAGGSRLPAASRAHFFGASARAMRQILVDMARRRTAARRGGKVEHVRLEDQELAVDACAEDLLDLNAALVRLAAVSDRLSRVIECRFFGGLSVEETAEVMQCTPQTVKRDWRKARAWLYQDLYGPEPAP